MISLVDEKIDNYANQNSSPVSDLLEELREYTYANVDLPQMQVGALEGNFLRVLAQTSGARRIVEVGTFTGYSALMMAAGLPDDGELITCELSDGNADIAQSFFDRSPHGHKIRILRGPAAESLAQQEGPFDMAFIDADKSGYITYFDLLRPKMRSGGLIVADNVLWGGHVLDDPETMEESTRAILAFNQHIQKTDLQKVMLPVRDGMTLIVV